MIWRLTGDPAPADPRVQIALEQLFQPPGWTWAAAGDTGWWVQPDWRDILLDPQGRLRLDAWRAQGRLQTVKAGPHRVVYRVRLPESFGNVYIKHFLLPNFRARFRQWIRRGKARNEARRAVRLAAAGVSTIEPLALGEQRRRGFLRENWLITREIPGTQPLDQLIEQTPPGSRLRQQLACALGVLTARLHDGGFIHTDYHPGNVLVRIEPSGEPHLAMIDLDALRIRRTLTLAEAVENLALLHHAFLMRSSRTDRLRYLAAYRASRTTQSLPPLHVLARQVAERTLQWTERLWQRTGRRCESDNKYFATYRSRAAWAVASRDVDPQLIHRLLQDPDAPFRDPRARPIKDSRTSTVVSWSIPHASHAEPVIYKRFNRKKLLDPWLNLFRPSRAWRAWRNAQHLLTRGVPTPRNLVVLGRFSNRARLLPHHFSSHETYLVTRELCPATTLRDYVDSHLARLEPLERSRRIRELTDPLARLIRTLHERGLSHRDLKAANILLVGDPEACPPRFELIDLVGVEVEQPVHRQHQAQNLARLWLSLRDCPGSTQTDALRFLRTYLGPAAWSRGDARPLINLIQEASAAKVRQNQRRNRQLS